MTVRDVTHPSGVDVVLEGDSAGGAKFYVQPVGAGPITVTALDDTGQPVGSTVIP